MGEPADWGQWRRPGPTRAQQLNDVWLGLVVLACALAMSTLVNSMGMFVWGTAPSLTEQLLWGAAVTAPLIVRRRFPVVVLFVIGVVFLVSQLRQVGDNFTPSVALFIAIYTTGAWEPNRRLSRWSRIGVIAVMFGWLGVGLINDLATPEQDGFEDAAGPLDPVLAAVLYNIGFNIVYFLTSYYFGEKAWESARRQAEIVRRAEELRRSQEENTRGAIVAERMRIARDLHDVVAHHVSVMGVQAGAARRVIGSDPGLASSALRTVEETARSAIGELNGLLGILRAEDGEPGDTTRVGLDQLPELVTTARSAGLEVEHGVYGEPRPVPDGVGLSAYRVVQEALTNVVKHARARKADVRVRYLDSTLEIEVTDDGRGQLTGNGGGFGLVGMRERIAVHGGELEAGPRQGAGYRVRASFPAKQTEDA